LAKPDEPVCNLVDGNDACSKADSFGHLSHSTSRFSGCSDNDEVVKLLF
jgi:hypothetical protein